MVKSQVITTTFICFCLATAAWILSSHWRINNSMKADAHSQTIMSNKKKILLPLIRLQPQLSKRLNVQAIGEKHRYQGFKENSSHIIVDLSDRRAYVYQQKTVIASYPIGIGKKGWETPTGTFKITNMQYNPAWKHPITGQVFPSGPRSPLGVRWIGFWTDGHSHIGFHGTPYNHVVGSPVSHGCLRMRNNDVASLYRKVRVGTQIQVIQ